MALDFPIDAVAGDFYQSGSSAVYQYQGAYWQEYTASTQMSSLVISASYSPSRRRNITKVSGNVGGALIVADNRLFAVVAGAGAGKPFKQAALGASSSVAGIAPGWPNIHEIPIPQESGSTLVDANCYGDSAYALFSNGNLYTWGENSYGQLGLSTRNTAAFVGFPELSTTDVAKVYWNANQGSQNPEITGLLIQKNDGYVYGCGYNGKGGLGFGLGTFKDVNFDWTQLTELGRNPLYVGTGGGNYGGIIAQKADGTVCTVGAGNSGWQGVGGTDTTTRSTFYSGSSTAWLNQTSSNYIVQHYPYFGVSTADSGTLGNSNLTLWVSNGTTDALVSAGDNFYGHMGVAVGNANYYSPVQFEIYNKRIKAVSKQCFGTMHVLYTDGTLYAAGKGDKGALGDGSVTGKQKTPVLLFSDVANLYSFPTRYYNENLLPGPIMQKNDGYLYSWGPNSVGAVGDGTSTNPRVSPVRIKFPQDIKGSDIKILDYFSEGGENVVRIAVTNDNRVFLWGSNTGLSINPASTENILIPTEIFSRALIR